MGLVGLGIIAFVCYVFYMEATSPKMTLTKSEWQCTSTRTVPITTFVYAGKVMVPVVTMHDECQQWTRR